MTVQQDWQGHPMEPATFTFSQTTAGRDGFLQIIRSHVAYDSRWPFYRRWWRT